MRQSADASRPVLESGGQWPSARYRHTDLGDYLKRVSRAMKTPPRPFASDFSRSLVRQRNVCLDIAALLLAGLLASPLASSAQARPILGKLFGGYKHVAIKVAELPVPRTGDVVGLAFSPDDSRIAVESPTRNNDYAVAIWNWRANHLETELTTPKGANVGLDRNPIQYSPDGQLLAVCGERAIDSVVVRIWKTTNWSIAKDMTQEIGGECTAIDFTFDGRTLMYAMSMIGENEDNVNFRSVWEWQQLWGLNVREFYPYGLAASPDSSLVAVNGRFFIRPSVAQAPDPVKRFQLTRHHPRTYLLDLQRRRIVREMDGNAMGPIAWSAHGRRIAVAGEGYVELFDVSSGKKLLSEKVAKSGYMNVRFTSDGRYFIESDGFGLSGGLGVRIWDSRRQRLLQVIRGDIETIAVSRNGRFLATGVAGRTTIWQFR